MGRKQTYIINHSIWGTIEVFTEWKGAFLLDMASWEVSFELREGLELPGKAWGRALAFERVQR